MDNALADDRKPMIALTFDDGPTRYDKRILAALEKAGGRATFFMMGRKVRRHKTLIRHILADGCEIGNHSWDHAHLDMLPAEEIRDQINKTNDVIRSCTGQNATVMRPPYGDTGGFVKPVLSEMGYASVLWSLDTMDWKTKSTANTISAVLHNVRDGDIVLMHSIIRETATAVELMVPELVRWGYKLVTVSELAAARGGMTPGEDAEWFRALKE